MRVTLRPPGLVASGLAVAVFGALAWAAPAALAAAAASPTHPPRAPVTRFGGSLARVSADSPTDAWAAGFTNGGGDFLLLHWDGTAWARVASRPHFPGELADVTAVSPGDAWAVGQRTPITSPVKTVVLHWDGTSWTQMASPTPGPAQGNDILQGVSEVSASDVWAVGTINQFVAGKTLVEHWDGSHWTQLPSPNPSPSDNELRSVSADSPTDAWAVGTYGPRPFSPRKTLMLHWNGTNWTQVPSPNPGQSNELGGVVALSPTNAWAVGGYGPSSGGKRKTLVLHWDGTTWTQVPSPTPGGARTGSFLESVSASSPTDIWAAGSCDFHCTPEPLLLHWDGTTWTHVASPQPGGKNGSGTSGVSADSPSDAWASGDITSGKSSTTTLLMHWNGTNWTQS